MNKDNKEYYMLSHFSTAIQFLNFILEKKGKIDLFIIRFQLKESEISKYLDETNYQIIKNDFKNWNKEAQEVWIS